LIIKDKRLQNQEFINFSVQYVGIYKSWIDIIADIDLINEVC